MGVSTSKSAGVLNESDLTPTADHAPPHSPQQPTTPERPLVVIEARKSWVGVNLGDIWAYRELLYFLIWRDVKVRYKQTALGVVWVILQPLLMMAVFTLFFGKVAGIPSDGLPYALFAYAGLLPWTFFSSAAGASGNSMVNSSNLITKVYFPRMIVPMAAVGAGLVDFAISATVLAGLMIYYGVAPTRNLLLLPVLVLMLTMLTLGFGMWMSALNVKYRDIRLALPFLIQLWFFASPIIYPLSLVTSKVSNPELWRVVLSLNPMTGIVEGFRAALYGRNDFDWLAIGISAAVSVLMLVYAAFTFKRMEKSFADIV
ncbi:MAG TPA: ABC transporter permease [Pyrinomonadaceae bacterium]|jgi:lipopolysaccharide transport system permease protein|nr:ABC transporter permease [Pyrinomonadaceae bacterium]